MEQMSFQSVTPGYCRCGCGQKTPIADRNRKDRGHVKDQPLEYVVGHNRRWRGGPNVPIGMKWCGTCKKIKSVDQFYKNKNADCGLQGFCKTCARKKCHDYRTKNRDKDRQYSMNHKLRHIYKITPVEYFNLLEQQNHKCAICDQPENRLSKSKSLLPLSVDHDHKNGNVRGLLCTQCNQALGLLKEDPNLFRHAIEYLEKPFSNSKILIDDDLQKRHIDENPCKY